MSFDLLGELPHGTVVLEASAGTGKTHTIATLATRYVAEEGVPLARLMLVTFSRQASQELRERTRRRLTSAARALADPAVARTGDDALVAHLADADDAEVAQRCRRLRTALADLDAATICTTHTFCRRMLAGLGMAGDRELDVEVVEDVDDLAVEVADDLYLRWWSAHDAPAPPVRPGIARLVAKAALRDRQAQLVPQDAPAGTEAAERVRVAAAARDEVARRKRLAGLRDYDDLLGLLRDALADPRHGPDNCRRVRERYSVVLVDEFQDTDPVQWEVLRHAFVDDLPGSGRRPTLVLIGDPKQAIYAFRGGEVHSYLAASRTADRRETLTTNWRSDPALLDALDAVYGRAALGHPEIVVERVTAQQPPRLAGATPLRVRWLPQGPRPASGGSAGQGRTPLPELRQRIATDVADQLVATFRGPARLVDSEGPHRIRPDDVAVLVRTNQQAELVREALAARAVPAVLTGSTSVFEGRAAKDWLWFLQGLEQPHRPARVRLAALTPLVGRTADALDADATALASALLRELARLFEDAGLAAVLERVGARTHLGARLLATEGGERQLTDLRHLGELLDRVAVRDALGLAALTAWLDERIADPRASSPDRSRRLETDADAVTVMTVHASKGLEFPVVLVPFGWDAARAGAPQTVLLHDRGRRVLDLGGKRGPGYDDRLAQNRREEAGEELRLLYVALTRARSQVVTWWAGGTGTSGSALHRLLFASRSAGGEPDQTAPVPADQAVEARLAAWAQSAGGTVAVERIGEPGEGRWAPPPAPQHALDVARVTRSVDPVWRRTSYSALTASVHDAPHGTGGSEPEQPTTSDEPDEPVAAGPAAAGADSALPSPMTDLPAGAAFGTLVHAVLETVDTGAPDLAAELTRSCRHEVGARLAPVDPDALAAALLPVLRTPLDDSGRTLAGFAPADRLAELDFELPLAGGATPAAHDVLLGSVAALLRRHLPAGDPLAGYPDLLESVEAPPLRGYLTGSIDAVLRVRGATGPRYTVVDYKTNRLGTGELSTAHYTRDAMATEMLRAHYPLQALLYAVALHRYLRWRQPGYDPAVHLGGVAYLFVRGMAGPGTPEGCGVFDWTPPPALVSELSDLLAGVAR